VPDTPDNTHDAPFSDLWANYFQDRSDKARNALVEVYLPEMRKIVHWMSRSYPQAIPLEDLIQEASIGLMSAVRTYKPCKGVKFTTYMQRRIRGAVLDYLRRIDWQKRITLEGVLRRSDGPGYFCQFPSEAKTKWGSRAHEAERHVPAPRSDEGWRRVDDKDELNCLMAQFTRRSKLLVRLYLQEGMSYKESARVAGYSETSAFWEIKKIRKILLARVRYIRGL